jgi:hypothetical protein
MSEPDAIHEEPIDGIFTDLGDAHIEPPTWVIENMLPTGITFIAGPAKTFKSMIALAMSATAADLPHEVLPVNMRKGLLTGTVMMLSAEASAGTLRHTAEVGMGITVPNDKRIVVADDPWRWRLDDEGALDTLIGWLNHRMPRVFVLDPLRDFHGLDEKDDGGMNRLLRPIQRWAVENRAAFVVVHHTKKKNVRQDGDYDALDMRGSSALFAIADAVIMVTPRGGNKLHMVTTFKRGDGWSRDFSLGVWGKKCEGGIETLTPAAAAVWAALQAGARNYGEMAKQLTVSKATIVESVAALERVGAVSRKGRSLVVNDGGDAIVKAATKEEA